MAVPISAREGTSLQHISADKGSLGISGNVRAAPFGTAPRTGSPADQRLGFIIEDDPMSPAVVHDKDRVDLYGYTTMAVATLKVQSQEIEALRREVHELKKELESARSCK
jgi:hypothetical protein